VAVVVVVAVGPGPLSVVDSGIVVGSDGGSVGGAEPGGGSAGAGGTASVLVGASTLVGASLLVGAGESGGTEAGAVGGGPGATVTVVSGPGGVVVESGATCAAAGTARAPIASAKLAASARQTATGRTFSISGPSWQRLDLRRSCPEL
jgi:hypothetical protein